MSPNLLHLHLERSASVRLTWSSPICIESPALSFVLAQGVHRMQHEAVAHLGKRVPKRGITFLGESTLIRLSIFRTPRPNHLRFLPELRLLQLQNSPFWLMRLSRV